MAPLPSTLMDANVLKLEDSKAARAYAAIGAMVRSGDLAGAASHAEILTRDKPGFARGWLARAHVAAARGERDSAAYFVRRAAALAPHDISTCAYAAKVLAENGAIMEAAALAHGAMRHQPREADLLDIIGHALTLCGDHAAARSCFERAAAIPPVPSARWFNLGAAQRYAGDIPQAEKSFEQAIESSPTNSEAHLALANLKDAYPSEKRIERLKKHLESAGFDWRAETQLRYALGKELERAGRWSEAFSAYRDGATLKRRMTQYDAEKELDALAAIEETHNAPSNPPSDGPGEEAIFIVGLPRTGSTLVERILGAHPGVTSKGELNDFANALVKQVKLEAAGRPMTRRAFVEAAARTDFGAVGAAYLQSARDRFPKGERFIDKMPLNSLYVGSILQALPKAKVIHVTRDPLDAACAIYTTLFNYAYAWSYDLFELADYMMAHERLMNHWRQQFGDRILSISYEELVRTPEAVTSKLLAHCALNWNDSCLRFFEDASPSTTASATQVRRPVYTTSVGRWRRYETEMNKVSERFHANNLVTWGKAGMGNA